MDIGTQFLHSVPVFNATHIAPPFVRHIIAESTRGAHGALIDTTARTAAAVVGETAVRDAAASTVLIHSAAFAAIGAAAGAMVVDGAGVLYDMYLSSSDLMTDEEFSSRLEVRGENFLRNLVCCSAGAALGSVLLTPLLWPCLTFLAPVAGGIAGNLLAAWLNSPLPAIRNQELVVHPHAD
jgi:hypothetical protein